MGSLGRGLDILRSLGTHGSVITVAELAAQPGNSRATAERLLHTLASEGFLHLIPDRADEGAYEPDLACLNLGTALLGSFAELWQRQPVLQDIARRFGVDLLVVTCDGAQALVIEHASASAVQQASLVGSVAPIESNAWGRCLVWMHSAAEQATLTDGIRQGAGGRAAAALGALYQAFQGLEGNGRCVCDLDERRVAIGMPVAASPGSPLLAIGCIAPRALLADVKLADSFWAQFANLSKLINRPVAAGQDGGKNGG
ncbi:MAG: helix-turn-helix domain-containing protein [Bdellovibrionales bacterium]|nr:helix-turn-helix domain-containing protein [Ramlibacter sp.]